MNRARGLFSLSISIFFVLFMSGSLYAKPVKSCMGLKAKPCAANKACKWKEGVCAKSAAGSAKPGKKLAKKSKKAAKAIPPPAPVPNAEDLNNLPELDNMGTGDGEDDF